MNQATIGGPIIGDQVCYSENHYRDKNIHSLNLL